MTPVAPLNQDEAATTDRALLNKMNEMVSRLNTLEHLLAQLLDTLKEGP